jgi:hypothetical protein
MPLPRGWASHCLGAFTCVAIDLTVPERPGRVKALARRNHLVRRENPVVEISFPRLDVEERRALLAVTGRILLADGG